MLNQKHQPQQLNEGLRSGDLKDQVNKTFTVDRYRSKMGEDKDVVVLSFHIKEKHPAIDLMEFIEKGYKFILDADMSTGEEQDGQYQVFVEMERTEKLPGQLRDLIIGVGQLCDNYDWKFRYQNSVRPLKFTEEAIMEHVPMTPMAYDQKILEMKTSDIQTFFNQGITEIALDENNKITFSRPYSGPIDAKFIAIGDYDKLKELVPGAVSLDEASQGEIFFLNKYLGNYDINKVGNNFLIRNGDQAVIIEKDRW